MQKLNIVLLQMYSCLTIICDWNNSFQFLVNIWTNFLIVIPKRCSLTLCKITLFLVVYCFILQKLLGNGRKKTNTFGWKSRPAVYSTIVQLYKYNCLIFWYFYSEILFLLVIGKKVGISERVVFGHNFCNYRLFQLVFVSFWHGKLC